MKTAILHAIAWLGVLLSCLLLPLPAQALGFSALVSPPRIEDTAKPGETYRNTLIYRFKTARAQG